MFANFFKNLIVSSFGNYIEVANVNIDCILGLYSK